MHHTTHASRLLGLALLLAGLLAAGCELDITNPNNPTEEEVLTSVNGIRALAIGMQEFYATETVEALVLTPAVTTDEAGVTSTLENLRELALGGDILSSSNANVLRLWSRNYRVISMAEDLLENAPQVPLDPGTESGILALAHFFKGASLGNLAMHFEQAPLTADRAGDLPFAPRAEVFAEALAELDAALAQIDETPPSSDFVTGILSQIDVGGAPAPAIDLRSAIQAYRARYHLFAGNYQAALDAADAVDLASVSVFVYSEQALNPVFQQIFSLDYYAPRDSFGLAQTEPGDGRVDFYTDTTSAVSSVESLPIDVMAGFFDSSTDQIPLYVPGEIPLIRAEANVRLGNLEAAVEDINAVRTKTPGEDPFGIGAGLTPYGGAVTEEALLNEVFYQRRAELFMQGLSLEDGRRLGQPLDPDAPSARNRNFYPYPDQERFNNPNTPPNPDI